MGWWVSPSGEVLSCPLATKLPGTALAAPPECRKACLNRNEVTPHADLGSEKANCAGRRPDVVGEPGSRFELPVSSMTTSGHLFAGK